MQQTAALMSARRARSFIRALQGKLDAAKRALGAATETATIDAALDLVVFPIESRVPFLDHKLVELTAKLPTRLKINGGKTKYILKEAMRGILPDEILHRPKMGFPVPVGAWFRGEYKHIVGEFVTGERALQRGIFNADCVRQIVAEHDAGANHDERIWFLVNFEMWQRRFLDGK